MHDIFSEIFAQQRLDPAEAARRSMRPPRRARLYDRAGVGEEGHGFPILLDGRPVRTPARRPLAAPSRPLAEALAAEWAAQRETVDPAAMPLTRLANAILDGVMDAPLPVRAEIEKYLGSDLLFYRADAPEGLVARQALHWDPLIEWAREALGARFVLAQGVVFVRQPDEALAAARAAIPRSDDLRSHWRLGALSSVTTLTGSALVALALTRGRVTADEAWAAAHVDEDWNMQLWGSDSALLERRAYHFTEMQAAAKVLALLQD